MSYKDKVNKVLSGINWIVKLGTEVSKDVKIESIPNTWSKFLDTEDTWVRLPIIEKATNTSVCLYKAKKGSVLPPHFHKNHNETIYVREGNVRIITPFYDVKLKKGDSFLIDKGVSHICEFSKEEESLIEISWCPPMDGWEGSFVKNK